MPDKNEKERRKQLMNERWEKENMEFEKSLPMSRELFNGLFDYLDLELSNNDCDHTLKLTEKFLKTNNIDTILAVKEWLSDKGGYCDCEVLANVEGKFEK